MANWPNDVDGDVFRRLEENHFDFSRKHKIDFEVDFEEWPPAKQAIILLQQKYPTVKVHEPEGEDAGYVHLELVDFLTYELVIRTQTEIGYLTRDSVVAATLGESWTVAQFTDSSHPQSVMTTDHPDALTNCLNGCIF